MTLFDVKNYSARQKLLLAVAAALLLVGLLWEQLTPPEPESRSVAEALERVEDLNKEYPLEVQANKSVPQDLLDDTSEFMRVRQSLDLSNAPEPWPERVEREDYELYINVTADFLVYYFEQLGYTGAKIEAGELDGIPPSVAVSIPKGWADDMTVALKKSIFYRVVLPLILLENQAILADRDRVLAYRQKLRNRSPLSAEARAEMLELAHAYRLASLDPAQTLDLDMLDELLLRVDLIPASLAMGQAAYESGYGTSRFAHEGNALFGQWDWSEDRMRPTGQREGKGDYGIKSFPFPIDSVRAYMRNLNSHSSYAQFRAERAKQRGNQAAGHVDLNGHALAATLDSYSERGSDYTQELQGIITFNRLQRADTLRLLGGDPIYFD